MSGEKEAVPSDASKAKAAEAAAELADTSIAGPSSAPAAAAAADPAPAYQAYDSGPSGSSGPSRAPTTATATAPEDAPIPTVSEPFNFPSDAELPPYVPTATTSFGSQRPIAIPQTNPTPDSPFVKCYPPSLLNHGITQKTWFSFLDTLSAFLTAKVSDRAVSHAGDMAKSFAEPTKRLGKQLASRTKDVGKHIANNAKRGNIFGAAMGVVGGAISLPLSAAFGVVGTVFELPGSAIGAVVKKPQTPGQRAAAYAMVANKKWFTQRGLYAQMFDTNELAQLLGVSVTELLNESRQTKDSGAIGQLHALEGRIAPLEVDEMATLELATNTIWLVLAEVAQEEEAPKAEASTSSKS